MQTNTNSDLSLTEQSLTLLIALARHAVPRMLKSERLVRYGEAEDIARFTRFLRDMIREAAPAIAASASAGAVA